MTPQKTALITGASKGFGREIALALAQKGYHILALARSLAHLEALDDAIKKNGGAATLIPHDLNQEVDFDYFAQMLGARFSHLDALVLNAATSHGLKPLQDISHKEMLTTFQVNFHGQMALLKSIDPLLRKAQSPKIIGITDLLAQNVHPYFGAYALSKKALESALYLYAKENEKAGKLNVRIFTPKPMRTELRAQFFPGENAENIAPPQEQIGHFLTFFG